MNLRSFEQDVNSQQLEESLWAHIDLDFAKPISPDASDIDYIPTQILAETFRKYGAKGLVYKSAMSNSDGYNLIV